MLTPGASHGVFLLSVLSIQHSVHDGKDAYDTSLCSGTEPLPGLTYCVMLTFSPSICSAVFRDLRGIQQCWFVCRAGCILHASPCNGAVIELSPCGSSWKSGVGSWPNQLAWCDAITPSHMLSTVT